MSHFPWSLYLRYDANTGAIQTIPARERHPSCSSQKLNAGFIQIDSVLFVSVTLNKERFAISAGRLVHLLHTGSLPDREPTYVNGMASDLRWVNLRVRHVSFVTSKQNPTNARVQPVLPGAIIFAPHDADDYSRALAKPQNSRKA